MTGLFVFKKLGTFNINRSNKIHVFYDMLEDTTCLQTLSGKQQRDNHQCYATCDIQNNVLSSELYSDRFIPLIRTLSGQVHTLCRTLSGHVHTLCTFA